MSIRKINITAEQPPSDLYIGRVAENEVTGVEFDLTPWIQTYGAGTATIVMKRWGDTDPYPIALEIDENGKATWMISEADVAKPGYAYAQLSFETATEKRKKSPIYTLKIGKSLIATGEQPDPYDSWLEALQHLAAKAMAEALDIEGIATDDTLSIEGGIADAKAAGDALALKADKSTTYTKTEVDQMIEDVEVETDTTLAIAGAPADAKKVGDELSDIKADLGALETEVEQVETAGVPTSVRQAICAILESSLHSGSGLTDEMSAVRSWASAATAITLNTSTASITGSGSVQLTATTTPSGLPVLWSSSDLSVATVSDVGLVSGVNNGTATITATCGDRSATCTVTVSGFATLTSITAVYTQSGEVRESTPLDSLKSDLVVTATYSDSTTITVSSSAYTLSGTLTTGTSTITVSYGGKTTTFNVTVAGAILLNSWDFKTSLVDAVGGVTATTQSNVLQNQTGLVFQANKNNSYADFGETYGRNRTYEVDVLEIEPTEDSTYLFRRFIMFDTDNNTGSGGAGLICCKNAAGKNGWYFYLGSGWDSAPVISGSSSDFKEDAFDGKTVKVYLDADGYAHLHTKTIGANDSTYEYIGSSGGSLNNYTGGHVYFGSSSGNVLGPATFTGLRIYGGEK